MCGITGYLDRRGIRDHDPAILTAMTAALLPRGPDGQGTWRGETVALGHTRLAILGIDGGAQPMVLRPDTVLVFGGEIYNYVELRAELAGRGHTFRTDGDTEVLLHAYREWGPACVERLEGMFAFAIWDAGRRQLLLVRDRLGVKPLYLHHLTDEQGATAGIVFGSEIKALLAHPAVSPRMDAAGLNELYAMMPMRTPGRTPLDGIRELRPGHLLHFTPSGVREECYWKLDAHPHADDLPTTIERVRADLTDIVGRQTRAHRPVAALLSGGVDSSATAALAATALSERDEGLTTFCIDYPSADGVDYTSSLLHDGRDADWAEQVAKHIGSSHHTVVVTADDMMDAQAATLNAMDLPSLPHVNVPLAVLFRAVAGHAPVVISGEGADELFRGYTMHHDPHHDGFPWRETYPHSAGLLTTDAWRTLRPDRYLADRYAEALAEVPRLPGEDPLAARHREITYLIITHYLPFLLRRVDRLSMAAGVEARVPFCDHRLARYAFNVPPELLRTGDVPKGLLRTAVSDVLPADVAWRPKSGFPVAQTARYQKVLWAQVRDLLATPGPVTDLLDKPRLTKLLDATEGDVSSWAPLLHVGHIAEVYAWQAATGVTVR
ncbi:asparagine synthase (glutamine-hydrolyzing) [Micromonospora sp. NPDC004704]